VKIFLLLFLMIETLVAAAKPKAEDWDALLRKHVKPSGGVDYPGFKSDETKLKLFIDSYQDADHLLKAEPKIKLAAYINLYNATMIFNLLRYAKEKKIPISSPEFLKLKINDIKVSGGNIWNGDYKVAIGKFPVNLDEIEHGLIRREESGDYDAFRIKKLDPRIHSAVNCAAKSCPRVREKAYTRTNIDQMLDENMKEYLSDNRQFQKIAEKKMQANSIVYWYYGDFDDYAQEVLKLPGAGDYLAQFVKRDATNAKWKVKHLKDHFNDRSKFTLKLASEFSFAYDWQVNDIRNVKN
jgi:hypothetical protein